MHKLTLCIGASSVEPHGTPLGAAFDCASSEHTESEHESPIERTRSSSIFLFHGSLSPLVESPEMAYGEGDFSTAIDDRSITSTVIRTFRSGTQAAAGALLAPEAVASADHRALRESGDSEFHNLGIAPSHQS